MNIFSKYQIISCLILITFFIYNSAYAGLAKQDYEVNTVNMKRTVKYLSTLDPPRNYLNTVSLNKSANYIIQNFSEYGLRTEEQEFEVSGKIYKNIIASAGPMEGIRIIVGAHYDVCGDQPGADDNASAVAGLLEIARFAKAHEEKLKHRIDFVAYTLEEPPFFGTQQMGSYVHAKSLHDDNIPVKGMICLEMIGFYTDMKKSQKYPVSLMRLFYRTTGDFISIVSNFGSSSLANHVKRHIKKTTIKVETLKAPKFITGVDFSDHRNYWEFGYDAIMITDTAFYRNPNYHKASDIIDTLDFVRMKEVVKGICWSLMDME